MSEAVKKIIDEVFDKETWSRPLVNTNPFFELLPKGFLSEGQAFHPSTIRQGNKFEILAKRLLAHFYPKSVSRLVAGWGVTDEESKTFLPQKGQRLAAGKQYILTRINFRDNKSISKFAILAGQCAHRGKQLQQKELSALVESIDYKNELGISDDISLLEVDLVKINDGPFISEVRSSGQTDNRKTAATMEKDILKPYICLAKPEFHFYYSLCYDNGQRCPLLSHLSKDMMLVGRPFWEKVLPADVNYKEFELWVAARLRLIAEQRYNWTRPVTTLNP